MVEDSPPPPGLSPARQTWQSRRFGGGTQVGILMLMYCTNCGLRRLDGAIYCHHCGYPMGPFHPPHRGGEGPARWSRVLVPWRSGQVAVGILLLVIAVIPATAIAVGAGHLAGQYREAVTAWIGSHLTGIAIIAVVWRMGLRRYGVPVSALGLAPLGLPRVKVVFMTLGALLVSLTATAVYAYIIDQIGVDQLSPPDVSSDIVFPGPAALLTFQALAVWTPLTEELFFRGFIFAGLSPLLGVKWAVIASAVVFSLFHLSSGVLIPVFITGVLLAWLYQKTGTLWPSIVAHAAQNALAVAVEVYGV